MAQTSPQSICLLHHTFAALGRKVWEGPWFFALKASELDRLL